jgi:hypothetical protein
MTNKTKPAAFLTREKITLRCSRCPKLLGLGKFSDDIITIIFYP